MIKISKILISLFLTIVLLAETATAQMVELKKEKNRVKEELKVAAFLDYPPFGNYANPPYRDSFSSIFQPIVEDYAAKQNFEVTYVITKNYSTLVRDVRRGEIDMLLGMYHETAMYMGLEYVFPAAVNNPIVAIMLPGRIHEVKSRADLKKLRGAMSTHEHLSDFVAQELKQYNVKKFEKSLDMYERLFAGQIDYILGSRYFSMIEAAETRHLQQNVSFSKQTIWKPASCLSAISKTSIHKKLLSRTFTALMEKPETTKRIEQILIDTIKKVEKETEGRWFPPSFSSDKPLPDIAEPVVDEQPNTMIMIQAPGRRK